MFKNLIYEFKEVQFGSKEYLALLNFRYQNLRKPLGLEWSESDLENENKQYHFGVLFKNKIIGSCLLKKISGRQARIRQMAIKEEFQNLGLGKKLLNFVETYAKNKKYSNIIITARFSAVGFYKKQGFNAVGNKFIDVTVVSIMMKKNI